jgi:hypothetical protein
MERARRIWKLSSNPVGDLEKPRMAPSAGIDVFSSQLGVGWLDASSRRCRQNCRLSRPGRGRPRPAPRVEFAPPPDEEERHDARDDRDADDDDGYAPVPPANRMRGIDVAPEARSARRARRAPTHVERRPGSGAAR